MQDTERWRTILGALSETGQFRGYVLLGNDEPIAYLVGSLLGHRFGLVSTCFQPVYRNLSPGTVLLNRSFEALASENVSIFDFGSLYADYKRLHATRTLREKTVHVYGTMSYIPIT